MSRPLRLNSTNLQEFSDDHKNRLSYLLRVAYADHVNGGAGNGGSIYVASSGNTSIGSLEDHKSTAQINTQERNNSGDVDYPSYPNLGTTTVATFNYRQNRNGVTAPSDATLNDQGYTYIYNTSHIRVAGASTIISEIVDHAITQLRSGDEVGSYRVSTGTPSNGGAGTWDDKGTWFTNTTYDQGTTTYKLWLKRSLSSVPGTALNPIGKRSDHDLQERSIATSGDLIQNILLPLMINRGLTDATTLQYNVGSGSIDRGQFKDTKQTGSTTDQGFGGTAPVFGAQSSTVYWRTRIPSGAASDDGVTNLYLV